MGTASTMKRALKLAKRRLGTHRRGKMKREELQLAVQRSGGAQAAAASERQGGVTEQVKTAKTSTEKAKLKLARQLKRAKPRLGKKSRKGYRSEKV